MSALDSVRKSPKRKEKEPEKATRRTQGERRETMTRRLLDAARDELVLSGYAGATTARVCERAGVSQGALFRHFPTREALMVAVAEDVGARLLASYEAAFRARSRDGAPLDELLRRALRLVREHCLGHENQALYELVVASRVDPRLREVVGPRRASYHAAIVALSAGLFPGLAEVMGEQFSLLVGTLLAVFDGEALHGFVLPRDPAVDEARIELLVALVMGALPRSAS